MPDGVPGDDEFDRALRSITEGTAGRAKFREPSAAEREELGRQARKREERAKHVTRPGKRRHRQWRAWAVIAIILVAAAVLTWLRLHQG
jgi:hypothetical protein